MSSEGFQGFDILRNIIYNNYSKKRVNLPSLVLASASPRRRLLLRKMGLKYGVKTGNVVEKRSPGESARSFAIRMGLEKARKVAGMLKRGKRGWIIGADTVVTIGSQILGKPKTIQDARRMLGTLQGRSHRVITGLALVRHPEGDTFYRCSETVVTIKKMGWKEREEYIKTGEPFGKAGAYAIQGKGRRLVESFRGSYTNVVGLPLTEVRELLEIACGRNR